MANALFAMAFAQLAVPVPVLAIWEPPFAPGIAPAFALNAVFALLFVGSGRYFGGRMPRPRVNRRDTRSNRAAS